MVSIKSNLKAIIAGLATTLGILGASVVNLTLPIIFSAIAAGLVAAVAVWNTPWIPKVVNTIPVVNPPTLTKG